MNKTTLFKCFFILCVCFFVGCAAKNYPQSGFIKDYSVFKNLENTEGDLFYRNPDTLLYSYSKVMIDPVEVYYHPVKERKIDPADLKKLKDTFRKILVDVVAKKYSLSKRPGLKVMEMRVALFNINPDKKPTNVESEEFLSRPLSLGEVSVEVEFIDSLTKKRIAAYIAPEAGKKVKIKEVSKWDDASKAFFHWAKLVYEALEKSHRKGGVKTD